MIVNTMDAYPGIGVGVAATGTNNYNLYMNVDKAQYANNLEYAFYEGNTQLQGALIEQSGTINYPVSYTDENKSLDLRLRYYSGTLPEEVTLQPQVIASNHYYPFGMTISSLSTNSEKYRYGFNGKEKDDEWHGSTGTVYDYGFRIYDARIAKFLSVDPLTQSYPWYTPYQFAGNMPIWAIDLDGLEEEIVIYKHYTMSGQPDIKRITLDEVGPLGIGTLHVFDYKYNGQFQTSFSPRVKSPGWWIYKVPLFGSMFTILDAVYYGTNKRLDGKDYTGADVIYSSADMVSWALGGSLFTGTVKSSLKKGLIEAGTEISSQVLVNTINNDGDILEAIKDVDGFNVLFKGVFGGTGINKAVGGKLLEEALKSAFDASINEGFNHKFSSEEEFKEFQEELFYRMVFNLIPKAKDIGVDNKKLAPMIDFARDSFSKAIRQSLDEKNLLDF